MLCNGKTQCRMDKAWQSVGKHEQSIGWQSMGWQGIQCQKEGKS